MKKIKETEKGFYGCYWPVEGSRCAILAMLGDDCEDYMAKSAVKWLQKKFQVSVLTLSPAHKDYSHHNLPVERIGAAITYLKAQGIEKFGIAGASTTGMYALLAASYYPEITLTIAMTPADFVMEGFYQGKRDGQTEWPGDGESSASWEGKPLPYLPYAYRHPEYGKKMKEEAKKGGDLIASREIFVASEKAHPIREEEFIKIERIKGKLLLIGAEDDVLWETEKYIKRMEKRLAEREHTCEVESYIYEHATHFVFPEGMVKTILPVGGDLLTRVFAAGRKFPKECKAARIDIDCSVTQAVNAWKTV
ncbi:acyl-CoA thioester hydrolase [Roseburia sp. BX0805]|uniref:Acyl-CoA thioester hydrolase n=1 Tax=Roseburia yibonii TaxID=2763063 RepID=A0ABR7I9H7_9FIRM|nr:acyl-CoA thioester hydrolase/BAAT C-terminal domain-containing protein [Roseburia yibonii]MBC5753576.1 acyl-CoA thioester hydrolase [Roseburia yibonii]